MPGSLQAWYSLRDLEALGDREAVLCGEVELAVLTRLSPLLYVNDGRAVAMRLRCGRTPEGRVVLGLSFQVTLPLLCQRCLEPVEYPLDETVDWEIEESDSAAASASSSLESLVLGGDRVRPIDLLEDELIVSLPLVPRHASIDECGALAQNLDWLLRSQDTESTGPVLEVKLGE